MSVIKTNGQWESLNCLTLAGVGILGRRYAHRQISWEQLNRWAYLIEQGISVDEAESWATKPGEGDNPSLEDQEIYLQYFIRNPKNKMEESRNKAMLEIVNYKNKPYQHDENIDGFGKHAALLKLADGGIEDPEPVRYETPEETMYREAVWIARRAINDREQKIKDAKRQEEIDASMRRYREQHETLRKLGIN